MTWMQRLARLAMLFVGAILIASCSQVDAPSEPRVDRQAEGLQTDYTEEVPGLTQTEYAIVSFKSPPAASYTGDIPGLARTKPEESDRLDENSPAVRAYLRHLENEHANFRSFLRRGAPRAEIVQEYFLTLNAAAVELNGASLRDLRRGPDVRAAAYSTLYRPTMNRSVGIVSADEFWSATGNEGLGIDVAIIDSGIDFDHPFFDCKSPNEANVYASGVAFFDPTRVLAFDHGTHVAGIVAGCEGTSGPAGTTLSGVAPDAEVHDYNVFPGFGAGFVAFGGSAFSHDIAAAIEDAVRDDMHIINMSLGGPVDGPHDFLAEASNAAVDAGVVVVTSAGNAGPDSYTVGSPGTAEKVITVAATTNSHTLSVPVELDFDADEAIDETVFGVRGDFDPFAENPADGRLVTLASNYGDELACESLDPALPDGSVVLIARGACFFSTKIANAAAAGAYGAIVYNDEPGEGAFGMAGEGPIPAVMISYEAGQVILDGHEAGTTLVSIDGNDLQELDVTPDVLAGFSSRGPASFTGIIKPELAAPGVNVLSSVFEDDFALFSGTSMSSPHVAGAAALLLSLDPGLDPAAVKAAIVNSADPLDDPDTSSEYSYAEVGNGRLNVAAAEKLEFLVSPPVASFGFHNRGGRSQVREVDLTVSALDGHAVCTLAATGNVTPSTTGFTVEDEAIVTLQLDNRANRSGSEEGQLDFVCDGQTIRVPWASYAAPRGQP